MAKERYQNPSCGDEITLRLFTYQSNNRSNVQSITEIKIYVIDDTLRTSENPEGLRLIETIDGSNVVEEETGQYSITFTANTDLYIIGNYYDAWTVVFATDDCASSDIYNKFKLYSHLWFTSPVPLIYDFNFNFRPNRLRKGSKRYVMVQITPNVPRGADITPYYENLAIVSDLKVSMSLSCGECVPAEEDLRLVVDRHLVEYREKGYGYWYFDTSLYEEGIYDVWFELALGENIYLSEKNALQIFS
jgi:hypothetical protein